MIAAFLFEAAWKSALCAGAALIALRLMRRGSAAQRSFVAATGLFALAILPLAMLVVPALNWSTPAAFAPVVEAINQSGAVASSTIATTSETRLEPSIDGAEAALWSYLAVATTLIVSLLLGTLRLQRIRGRAEVLDHPDWLVALVAAQRRLGIRHGTALLSSAEISSPISWGVVRPIVVVDAAAARRSTGAEAILAHELAHVARLDWFRLILGRLAICLFWFNPLVWLLARHSQQLCEEAADDAVLCTTVARADYADILLTTMRRSRPSLLPANGVAPSQSSLGRRIENVLDGSRSRSAMRTGWAAIAVVGALSANAVLAAVHPIVIEVLDVARPADAGHAAAGSLARLGHRQTDAIAHALRSGDWDSRRVEPTLMSDRRAIAPLIAALDDRRPVARRIGIWGLSEMRPTAGPQATRRIAALLGDSDPGVRASAASALGEVEDGSMTIPLIETLKDGDAAVRIAAAHALGDRQDVRSRAALAAATRDPDPDVRAEARWALKRVGEANAILRRPRPD